MSYCVFIQVLGDNLRSDGQYDIACFFYEKCTRKEDALKLNDDKWWFVKIFDVCKIIKDPVEERVSGKRKLYYFNY